MMLTKPLRGTVFSKRLTQRNLASVLEHISFVDPAESNLLRTIEHPHASASKAVFGPELVDQSRLKKIKSWIEKATGKQIEATRVAEEPPSGNAREKEDAPSKVASTLSSDLMDVPNQSPTETLSASDVISEPSSADPYDPAAFNDSGS